jgi:hypothetical protein
MSAAQVVAVAGIEVRSGGLEGDEAPISGDRRVRGSVVPFGASGAAGAADERGRHRLQVTHENIVGRVAVAGINVRSGGLEGDEASVGRNRWIKGVGVRLGAGSAGGAADQVKVVLRRAGAGGQRRQHEHDATSD